MQNTTNDVVGDQKIETERQSRLRSGVVDVAALTETLQEERLRLALELTPIARTCRDELDLSDDVDQVKISSVFIILLIFHAARGQAIQRILPPLITKLKVKLVNRGKE
jgi:hypothetical protein